MIIITIREVKKMAPRDIGHIVRALEPFYNTTHLSQNDCAEYMDGLREALAYHDIELHKAHIERASIPGSESTIMLRQEITANRASHLIVRRYNKRFGIIINVFSEYDDGIGRYIPKVLDVQTEKHGTIHNYVW